MKSQIIFTSYDDIKNPHYAGGGAIAIHELAKRLAAKYFVTILSWNASGKKTELIDDVRYERFGISSLSPRLGMFVYQFMLPFVLIKKNYDVLFESFCPPFTTSFLPAFIKKPLVGVVHMLAAEDMERKYKLPFHLVQNKGIQYYNNIIVTSESLQKKVKQIHKEGTVLLISNGIEKVYQPTKNKKKYLLFLGRIEVNQKGVDLLISAFSQFHAKYPDYQLVIAGSGSIDDLKKMQKLIKEQKLSKHVVLKGRVADKRKGDLLRGASCLILPSRFETYSLVALEAMAHGAPIVCFAIDGLSWIPKKAAKRVIPFSISGLAKAMETIIQRPSLSAELIKEGNTYAKKFTWDAIAKQYDNYITRLLPRNEK